MRGKPWGGVIHSVKGKRGVLLMVEYVLRIAGEADGDVVRLDQEHFDAVLDLALRCSCGEQVVSPREDVASTPDSSVAPPDSSVVFGTVETVPDDAEFVWRGAVISEEVCERLFSAGFSTLLRQAVAERQVEADPYRDLRLHEELI